MKSLIIKPPHDFRLNGARRKRRITKRLKNHLIKSLTSIMSRHFQPKPPKWKKVKPCKSQQFALLNLVLLLFLLFAACQLFDLFAIHLRSLSRSKYQSGTFFRKEIPNFQPQKWKSCCYRRPSNERLIKANINYMKGMLKHSSVLSFRNRTFMSGGGRHQI